MADVFLELDEAIKRERLEKFIKNYGTSIIAFMALCVFGTAILSAYRAWDLHVRTEQTASILEAAEQKNPAQALSDRAGELRPGLRDLAKMTAAADFLEKGEKEKALSLYKEVSQDEEISPELRDLAGLYWAGLTADKDAKVALAVLARLWGDEKNPWRHHARFETALILANKMGDFKGAREQLAALMNSKNVPQTLTRKAVSLDILYGLKETDSAVSSVPDLTKDLVKNEPEAKKQ